MRKHVSESIISIIVIIYGVFMLLTGLGIFPFSLKNVAFIATCMCLFISSLIVAVIQHNPIGLFFTVTFAVLTFAGILLLVGYTSRNIYPVYISSVFAGGVGIYAMLPYLRRMLKVSLAMLGGVAILLLESFEVLHISIVLPILIIYFAILGLIYSLLRLSVKEE